MRVARRGLWIVALAGVISAGCGRSSEEQDRGRPGWFRAAQMLQPRFFHTATLLADGRVLITGGCSKTFFQGGPEPAGQPGPPIGSAPVICAQPLKSAEIYDPDREAWSEVAPMTGSLLGGPPGAGGPQAGFQGRFEHAAVLVPGGPESKCSSLCGNVLVVGGDQYRQDATGLNLSAEAFNPSTNKWQGVPAPNRLASGSAIFIPAGRSSACGEACGKVVMIGSTTRGESVAELFDPGTISWREMAEPSVSLGLGAFSATLLPSGEILVLGGVATAAKPPAGGTTGRGQPSDPALYDPEKNSWRLLSGAGSVFRNGHTASLLNNGLVLVAGGTQTETSQITGSAEFLASDRFRPAPRLHSARSHHIAASLANGRVLVMGGTPARKEGSQDPSDLSDPPPPEEFAPQSKRWTLFPEPPTYRGSLRKTTGPVFTAVELLDSRILVAGGIGVEDRALRSADIYRPSGQP